jgi:hypothetical protein
LQKKINSLFPLLLLMMAVIYKVSPEEMACPAVSDSIAQEKAKSSALGRKESKAYED